MTALRSALAVLLVAVCSASHAQGFPSKPIRLITQYIPGSSGDNNLRLLLPALNAALGQPVVIDNRAGAGGVVAAESVIRSAPDGYTLLASNSATHVIRPFMVKTTSFDPARDLTPVTQLTEGVACIVVGPATPATSFKELLDYSRKNPGQLAFGTSGIGSEHHLTAEEIMQMTGVKWLHVPYKSGIQAMTDTMSGQLPMAIGVLGGALPLTASGKLRILAIVRDRRLERMPDLPAVGETIPGFEAPASWSGIFGPANLPPAIANRLSSAFLSALKIPDTREKLAQGGSEIVGSTPGDFAAAIKKEMALVGNLVKAAGIKAE